MNGKIPLWRQRDRRHQEVERLEMILDLLRPTGATREFMMKQIEEEGATATLLDMLELIGDEKVGRFLKENLDVAAYKERRGK